MPERHNALLAAARNGDLDAVIRFFEDPDVRAHVAVWNAEDRAWRRRERAPTEPLGRPWFDILFQTIAGSGQVEVFRWFLSWEQIEQMGDTLRTMTTGVVCSCLFDTDVSTAQEIMEVYIESPLSTEVTTDDEGLSVLNQLLNTAVSRGFHKWMSFLLAYGADPNLKCDGQTPIGALAFRGNTATLDVLLDHGAWLEGGDTLTQRPNHRDADLVGHLFCRGADANAATSSEYGSALYVAASCGDGEIVQLLVDEGFANVDARNRMGCTPLMAVADGRTFILNRNSSCVYTVVKAT